MQIAKFFNGLLGQLSGGDEKPKWLLAILLLTVVVPLDLPQLAFAFAGAFCYILTLYITSSPHSGQLQHDSKVPKRRGPRPNVAEANLPSKSQKSEVREAREAKAIYESKGRKSFEDEVAELLVSVLPGLESRRRAEDIAQLAQQAIRQQFPDAEVNAFAYASVMISGPFAVAVPDIDLVVSTNPEGLKTSGKTFRMPKACSDEKTLQKALLRACADRLVNNGGFKFRRSYFRGSVPKLTFLAPTCDMEENLAVDLYVNSAKPFQHAALLAECAHLDVRTRGLLAILRCWAKSRAVCHASRGHPSPYAWNILAIYFLQECGMLPALEQFPAASLLIPPGGQAQATEREFRPSWRKTGSDLTEATAGSLLKDMFRFFNTDFHWEKHVISILASRRLSANGAAPHVEDPFAPSEALCGNMPLEAKRRFFEELKRADGLCGSGATLEKLLTPWTPSAEDQEFDGQ